MIKQREIWYEKQLENIQVMIVSTIKTICNTWQDFANLHACKLHLWMLTIYKITQKTQLEQLYGSNFGV